MAPRIETLLGCYTRPICRIACRLRTANLLILLLVNLLWILVGCRAFVESLAVDIEIGLVMIGSPFLLLIFFLAFAVGLLICWIDSVIVTFALSRHRTSRLIFWLILIYQLVFLRSCFIESINSLIQLIYSSNSLSRKSLITFR